MSARAIAQSREADHSVRINWDEIDPWTATQLKRVLSYCSNRGWDLLHISGSQSCTLENALALWQVIFSSNNKSKSAWIITGDLPIDIIPFNNAPNARDALLHFSKKFLSKAQLLKERPARKEETHQQIELFVKAAADLLVLYHEDSVWE